MNVKLHSCQGVKEKSGLFGLNGRHIVLAIPANKKLIFPLLFKS